MPLINCKIELKLKWSNYNSLVLLKYSSFAITTDFCLVSTTEKQVLKTMQDIKSSKAAGTDEILGRFSKDSADILAKPVSALCNLSRDNQKLTKVLSKGFERSV